MIFLFPQVGYVSSLEGTINFGGLPETLPETTNSQLKHLEIWMIFSSGEVYLQLWGTRKIDDERLPRNEWFFEIQQCVLSSASWHYDKRQKNN